MFSRMMRLAMVIAFSVIVAACEANCSVSSASLSEEAMANAVTPDTKAPVAAVTSFTPDASAIYATAKLSNAPADTKIKATFHYLEGGEREIAAQEVTAEGTRYVMFTLTPPATGWPAGQYETRFFLDSKEGRRLPFNVAARPAPAPSPASASPAASAPPTVSAPRQASAPPAATAPPAASAPRVKQFHDDKFGLTLELPEAWAYHVTPDKNYLFEGPKGTEAYELSIILQFVTKSANPGSSAAAQLQGLAATLERAPNATFKTRDSMSLGGQPAPFFTVTYDAKNSAGEVVPFIHAQIAVDHGQYYYLISYSGPAAIYKQYLPVFEHLVGSFAFTS